MDVITGVFSRHTSDYIWDLPFGVEVSLGEKAIPAFASHRGLARRMRSDAKGMRRDEMRES